MSETLHRQPRVPEQPVDDAAVVTKIASLIVSGVDDERLRWTADRSSCRLVGVIVAPEALRQRCEERLRRFNEALRVEMAGTGWIVSGGWWRRPRPRR